MSDAVEEHKSPLQEIVQPFKDLARAPAALVGVNVTYLLEGFVYFGMLGYMAMFFIEYVGLDDKWADWMVTVLTGGITFAMFLFGGLADKWGARKAIITALFLMLLGRITMALGPTIGLPPAGVFSTVHLVATAGILLIVLGYGMYQPAAYSAVKQMTTEKTAAMGYAMLYAVMNLGGWLPSFFGPIRKSIGILGAYWVFVGITAFGLAMAIVLLSKKAMDKAREQIAAERSELEKSKADDARAEAEESDAAAGSGEPKGEFSIIQWLKNHPLADPKFSFFIFCLIPVQTLFAHNWLTLPQYVSRAYAGSWIGEYFEVAVNLNPLLIFFLVPLVAAATRKANVYKMMILGTFVMAAPTFLLALGPSPYTLGSYLLLMTIGEALWQPRFLQYAAEIAPEGRTGAYMGVAQFPWFLTKIVTGLYAGWFLHHYCPKDTPPDQLNTETMWFIYGLIAITSSIMLVLAKGWLGKDFKTKADA